MTEFDRRQVLQSVGAGAGTGLVGVAGARRSTTDEQSRDSTDAQAENETPGQRAVETQFTAEDDGGCFTLNGNGPCEVNEGGRNISIDLDELDEPLAIVGTIYGDRTWDSSEITFPPINPGEIIDPCSIDLVGGINLTTDEIEIVVNSITNGQYLPEDQPGGPLVEADVDMLIDAHLEGSLCIGDCEEECQDGDGDIEFELDFTIDIPEITLTSDQSGSLDGEAYNLTCAEPVVTLVNNNFTVPEAVGDTEVCIKDITCIDVNDILGLPYNNSIKNYIELYLDVDWEVDGNQQPQPGAPALPDDGGVVRPRDLDCDGCYEDVDGDGDFDIFDVHKLFEHRDDEAWNEHAELLDFGDSDPDDITIFDVQALHALLEKRETN